MHIVYLEDGTKKIMKLPNIVAVYGSDGKIQTFENGLTNDGEEFPPDIDDIGFSADGVNFSNLESIGKFPIDVIYYNTEMRTEKIKEKAALKEKETRLTEEQENADPEAKENLKKYYEMVLRNLESNKIIIRDFNKKYEKIDELKSFEIEKTIEEIERDKKLFEDSEVITNFIRIYNDEKLKIDDNTTVDSKFFDERIKEISNDFEEILKNFKTENILNEFKEINLYFNRINEFLNGNTNYKTTIGSKAEISILASKASRKKKILYSLVQKFKKNYIEFTIDDKVINSNYFDEFIKKYSENLDEMIKYSPEYSVST
jgi:hypothetical protein